MVGRTKSGRKFQVPILYPCDWFESAKSIFPMLITPAWWTGLPWTTRDFFRHGTGKTLYWHRHSSIAGTLWSSIHSTGRGDEVMRIADSNKFLINVPTIIIRDSRSSTTFYSVLCLKIRVESLFCSPAQILTQRKRINGREITLFR